MIIQCKQCRTKFRFDDAKIAQDGIWVRCNRCQHVFFQEPPRRPLSGPAAEGDRPLPSGSAYEKTQSRLSLEPASPPPGKIPRDEDLVGFLRDVMETEKAEQGKQSRIFPTRTAEKMRVRKGPENGQGKKNRRPFPLAKRTDHGCLRCGRF